jgi:hypothetical protein
MQEHEMRLTAQKRGVGFHSEWVFYFLLFTESPLLLMPYSEKVGYSTDANSWSLHVVLGQP